MTPLTIPISTVKPTAPTTRVASVSDSTPDTLITVPTPMNNTKPYRVLSLIVSNMSTIAQDSTVQAFIGIRYASGSGGSDWEPILAPILKPGDSVSADMTLSMRAGDELVVRASTTNLVNVTIEIGQ